MQSRQKSVFLTPLKCMHWKFLVFFPRLRFFLDVYKASLHPPFSWGHALCLQQQHMVVH